MNTGTTIPFRSLFYAECRKATDTRAARWLLAAAVLLALAAQAVPLAFPRDVTQDRASFLTWAALGLSRLLPIALMLTMTADRSQRTALATFTLEPRRGRVLAAKILAGLALSVIGGCLAFGIAQAGLTVALADGRRAAVGWSWPELAGFAAFIAGTSGIGSAIGSAVHNTAAAIVTYFALAAVTSLLLIPAVQQAGSWVDTSQTFGWMLTGQWSGHGPQIASSAAISADPPRRLIAIGCPVVPLLRGVLNQGCFFLDFGGMTVGDRVMIGPRVTLSTAGHPVELDERYDFVTHAPIVIEDDVWIGAAATITPGVTIGRGSVVGAGAVVAKDVPTMSVVTGTSVVERKRLKPASDAVKLGLAGP